VRNTDDGPVFDSIGESHLGARRGDVLLPRLCRGLATAIERDRSRWQVGPSMLADLIQRGYVKIGRWRDERTAISYLKRGEQQKVEAGTFPILGRRSDGSVLVDSSDYEPVFVPGTQWRITSHEAGGPGGANCFTPSSRADLSRSQVVVRR